MTAPIYSLLNTPLSKAFYFHFPTLRSEYTEIELLRAAFKKIEAFAVGSFPSVRKTEGNEELLYETIKAERPHRLDLFKSESDQGILSSLNSFIKAAPCR
jgi:hypothetical protein